MSQETPQAQARRIFGTYDPEGNMKFYPKPKLDVCLKKYSHKKKSQTWGTPSL